MDGGGKIALAGSYSKNIVIIDRATQAVEWNYDIPAGGECNSVCVTKGGDVLFSYNLGVMMVGRDKRTIFDYKVGQGEEAQSVSIIGDRILVGICGNPARIVELSMGGKPIAETVVELNIAEPHSQFRQISKTAAGTYLIPVMDQSRVVEVNNKGVIVKSYDCLPSPFSVRELANGNIAVSAGRQVTELDRNSGQVVQILAGNVIGADTIRFATQTGVEPSGDIIITNWTGHAEGATDAGLIIVGKDKTPKMRYYDTTTIRYISAFGCF